MSSPFYPFWLEQALEGEGYPEPQPLSETLHADVCIIGGGYTGLWSAIALRQARPNWRIVVLEKDLCGSGASGRNGGCMLTWSAKYLTLRRLFGEQQARWLVSASEQAVHAIANFCDEHGIHADLRLEGTLYTATNQAQQGGMAPVLSALSDSGLNHWQHIDGEQLASACGSIQHKEAHFSPYAGSVQPALLARGLLHTARAMGIEVYERSPMTELIPNSQQGGVVTIRTPQGQVQAGQVILAINSAMAERFREFRRSIVLVSSDMVITEPAPASLQQQQMDHGRCVVDGRTFVYYYRSTPDGRLMLGKGGNTFAFANRHLAEFDQPSRYKESLSQALYHFFPHLNKTPIAASWCGASDRSVDGLPFFGTWRQHPNIFYGFGYSGNGVTQSWIGGQILSALVCGEDNDWTRCALTGGPRGYFPPEPFRWVGAMLVRNAIRRKERAEDENRAPHWWDKQLAKLADAAGKADTH